MSTSVPSYRPTGTLDEEWEKFKKSYKKTYKDAEEEKKRKAIFAEALEKIKKHNVKYDAGEVSYSMGINHLADLKPDEIPRGLKPKTGVKLPNK